MTFEALLPDIKRASKSVASQWPGVANADDVFQEISFRLLESDGSVDKLNKMDDRQKYNSLVRIGHQIASQFRDDYDAFTGNYHYSVDEVRELLESGAFTAERKELKAELWDFDEAYDALNERYSALLFRRFALNDPIERNEKDALSRAVDALTDGMNKVFRNRQTDYLDGPGSRRAMTNASAQARTANQWSD